MKKKFLRSVTILTLTAMMFSVSAWTLLLARQSENHQTGQDKTGKKSKKLRDVAAEGDVEIANGEGEADMEFTGDLPALAKGANAIVIGRITGEEASFVGDNSIVTHLTVDVQRVLKETELTVLGVPMSVLGDVGTPPPLMTPLKVVRSGGVMHVNGHRASVKIKGDDLVTTGKDYVLFLSWSRAFKSFYLIGGVSGAVLVENSRVKPMTSGGEMKRLYNNADLETFIGDVLRSKQ